MKYGQVNHEAAMLTKPASIVSVVATHHHMFRPRKREINLRKKNRKAIFTEKMTSHQMFCAKFCFLETLGISPSRWNARSFSKPWKTSWIKAYMAGSVAYIRPVTAQRHTTAKSRM